MGSVLAMPPMTAKWLSITALQAVMSGTTYAAERMDPAPYSKFAQISEAGKKGRTVGSRTGMLIIYTPALLLASQMSTDGGQGVSDVPGLVATMLCAHFLKRVCEVLFLHKYSGGMPLAMACMIGLFYALTALLENYAVRTDAALSGPPGFTSLGSLLFLIGEAGNFYHHWLLAQLRKDKRTDVGYTVPQGGLFPYVNSPHYLFELVAWYGIAVAARQLNVLLVAVSMTGYLAGRSVGVTEFYRKNVQDFPASRKHLVPLLF